MSVITKKTIQEAQRLVKNAFVRVSMSLYYLSEKRANAELRVSLSIN